MTKVSFRTARKRPVATAAGITILGALILVLAAGRNAADEHVRYMMGGEKAPLNCVSCHAYMKKGGLIQKLLEEEYVSPHALAVSPDGSRLYVVAEKAEALFVLDASDGRTLGQVHLGGQPHSIVLNGEGTTAFVSRSGADDVAVVDLSAARISGTLPAGAGPAGLSLCRSEGFLYVANTLSDDISVVAIADGVETKRLVAGRNPYAVSLSPDGSLLYVTSRLSRNTGPRGSPAAEVTVIDTRSQRVVDRKAVRDAHIMEGTAFAQQGDLALVTIVRPKQLVPSTQVSRGWMLTYGLAVIEQGAEGRIIQLLLDDVNRYYADPYDVVMSRDGRTAFVSHAAANTISVVDLDVVRGMLAGATADSVAVWANHLGTSSRVVRKRIPTGHNPKRLALSPGGERLYAAERLEDRIAVIDTESLETIGHFRLGASEKVSTLRQGERLFHGSRAFQGQFSCRSCHPDLDQDALSWDFGGDGLGLNLVNSSTLREIGHTSPFKWDGTNSSLYMQDGIRFAKHLTRVESFPPRELTSLVAYIYSVSQVPNRYLRTEDELSDAQQRGKAVFERETTVAGDPIPPEARCITCHPPPLYTNRQKFDVGTIRGTDTKVEYDTPTLVNIHQTAPYLHDGSAETLEEIWTKNSTNDEHGYVSDLTKNDLNDLIEYLRTLGPPEEASKPRVLAASLVASSSAANSGTASDTRIVARTVASEPDRSRATAPAPAPASDLPRSAAPVSYAWTTLTTRDGLPSNKVFSVRADGERIWIGTDSGLSIYENGRIRTYTQKDGLAHDAVLSLDVDRATGDVWVGTMGGLSWFSAGVSRTFDQMNSGLANDIVYGVYDDGSHVWSATAAGASRYDKRTGQWAIYNELNAPMHEPWTYSITANSQKVYVGAWGGGLLEFDRTSETWKEYVDPDGEMEFDIFPDDGLVHDIVSGISFSEGVVWISTYFGVSLYDGVRWRGFFDHDSGLASNFVNTVRAEAGVGYFCTDKGLSSFDGTTWHTHRRLPDGRGEIISTDAHGNELSRSTMPTAIGHNFILGVDVQGDVLWLATEGGLSRGVPLTPRGESTSQR